MRNLSGIAPLLLMTPAAPAFAQQIDAVFPQVASGGGWSGELSFTIQDIAQVSGIKVSFQDTNGSPLSVDSNLAGGLSLAYDLEKGATQGISITPHETLVEGYAVVM